MSLGPVISYIKGHRIQWLGHIMRREESEPVFEWKLQGKIPRGRRRKKWLDGVEENLRELGIEDWEKTVHDRDRWCDIVVAVETPNE